MTLTSHPDDGPTTMSATMNATERRTGMSATDRLLAAARARISTVARTRSGQPPEPQAQPSSIPAPPHSGPNSVRSPERWSSNETCSNGGSIPTAITG